MHKQCTGFLDDLSPEQDKKVSELQIKLASELAKYPEINTKWSLLRFCRARQFDMKKVETMLLNFIKWRDSKDMKRIASRDYKDYAHIIEHHEEGRYGVDKLGRPVIIDRVGLSNTKEIMNHNDLETIEDYFIQMFERNIFIEFPLASALAGKRVEQSFLVIDLKNVNIGRLFDSKFKNFLKFIAVMSQDYYPEALGKMFIVNAPFLFKGVWAFVKIWLDKKTKNKIEMHGDVPIKRIQEFIGLANLPIFLHGSCKLSLRDNFGPWKDEIKNSISRKSFYLSDRTAEYEYFYTEGERKALGISLKEHNKLNVDMVKFENHEVLHDTEIEFSQLD